MAIHHVGVPMPGPATLLDAAQAVVAWGGRTVRAVAGLPGRAAGLLDGVERLLARITDLADRVEVLIDRVDAVAEAAARTVVVANTVAEGATGVVRRANLVTDDAGRITSAATAVTSEVAELTDEAGELLAVYRPLAREAAPLVGMFVNELSADEVTAAVRLVDQLPRLAGHVESDVMPILATLDRVGPDLRELLEVVKDLRRTVSGIPGLAYLRRRGERPEQS